MVGQLTEKIEDMKNALHRKQTMHINHASHYLQKEQKLYDVFLKKHADDSESIGRVYDTFLQQSENWISSLKDRLHAQKIKNIKNKEECHGIQHEKERCKCYTVFKNVCKKVLKFVSKMQVQMGVAMKEANETVTSIIREEQQNLSFLLQQIEKNERYTQNDNELELKKKKCDAAQQTILEKIEKIEFLKVYIDRLLKMMLSQICQDSSKFVEWKVCTDELDKLYKEAIHVFTEHKQKTKI